jgi:hypothetical protein
MDPGLLVPIMALMIPLVVVVGVTVRLTVKPIIEGLAKYKEISGGGDPQLAAKIERRLAAVEQHLETLDRSVGTLEVEADFRRQLEAGPRASAEPPVG